jgi:hypothetical protein
MPMRSRPSAGGAAFFAGVMVHAVRVHPAHGGAEHDRVAEMDGAVAGRGREVGGRERGSKRVAELLRDQHRLAGLRNVLRREQHAQVLVLRPVADPAGHGEAAVAHLLLRSVQDLRIRPHGGRGASELLLLFFCLVAKENRRHRAQIVCYFDLCTSYMRC